MTVGVLLLAAGRARRFGSDKRLALLDDGRTLLEASLDCYQQANLAVRLCLAKDDAALADHFADRSIEILRCRHSERGMGATLAEAASSLSDWQAALVGLADMPLLKPATVSEIAACAAPDRIVVPSYRGQPGHPVAFGAGFFPQLAQCGGDRGARWIIEQHADAVHEIVVDDPGAVRDVDTPRALGMLSSDLG